MINITFVVSASEKLSFVIEGDMNVTDFFTTCKFEEKYK